VKAFISVFVSVWGYFCTIARQKMAYFMKWNIRGEVLRNEAKEAMPTVANQFLGG
jgi:hypothetical protein